MSIVPLTVVLVDAPSNGVDCDCFVLASFCCGFPGLVCGIGMVGLDVVTGELDVCGRHLHDGLVCWLYQVFCLSYECVHAGGLT